LSTTRRRLGIAGAVVGAGAAGVGAAVAIRRYAVGRSRLTPDPLADEPFGQLRGHPLRVPADDGVVLHVEIDGPLPDPGTDTAAGARTGTRKGARTGGARRSGLSDRRFPWLGRGPRTSARGRAGARAGLTTPPTIVFCHGYSLNQDSWHYQRRDLRAAVGDDLRLVFWDQRGHGRSERGGSDRATIDQLGADLHAVLRATAPEGGPVVLVGHSMGGMTIMALADRHPELFGDGPVGGVALISTACGFPAGVTLGLPPILRTLFSSAGPSVVRTLSRQARLVERARRIGADLSFVATRRLGFVDGAVSPALVDFVDRMIGATSIEVIADFYAAVLAHDKRAALEVFDTVPTLVLGGDRDRFTPFSYSEEIAAAVSSAELVRVPGCAHLPLLEHPDVVQDALLGLLGRVESARGPSAGEQTA
jgi:pimeloyl-ACP methyl ester carboxylesterase